MTSGKREDQTGPLKQKTAALLAANGGRLPERGRFLVVFLACAAAAMLSAA